MPLAIVSGSAQPTPHSKFPSVIFSEFVLLYLTPAAIHYLLSHRDLGPFPAHCLACGTFFSPSALSVPLPILLSPSLYDPQKATISVADGIYRPLPNNLLHSYKSGRTKRCVFIRRSFLSTKSTHRLLAQLGELPTSVTPNIEHYCRSIKETRSRNPSTACVVLVVKTSRNGNIWEK